MKLLLVSKAEQVDILKGMLEKEGITTDVTDGETPFPGAEFYPRLWVVNDADFSRASAVLDDFRKLPSGIRLAWQCPGCGEQLEAQFDTCWKCGHEHPEGPLSRLEPEPLRPPPTRNQVVGTFVVASLLLLIAVSLLCVVAAGTGYITFYESKPGHPLHNTISLGLLAGITGPLGALAFWRAVGLRRRMLAGQYEPTA